MHKKAHFLIFSFLFFSLISTAQEMQYNAWNALFTDYSLTSSMSLRVEAHYRTVQFYGKEQQYFVRPQWSYQIHPNVNLRLGTTHIGTHQPGGLVKENNVWEQLSFSFPIKRATYFSWIRLEHRWQTQANNALPFGSRIRFRVGAHFPLSKAKPVKGLRFFVFNEVFLKIEKGLPYQYNQNWTFFGILKQLSPALRIISGYQRNTIDGVSNFSQKHIWSTLVFLKL
jgi:hypothetical protein